MGSYRIDAWGIVQLQLEREDVTSDTGDKGGRMPSA